MANRTPHTAYWPWTGPSLLTLATQPWFIVSGTNTLSTETQLFFAPDVA